MSDKLFNHLKQYLKFNEEEEEKTNLAPNQIFCNLLYISPRASSKQTNLSVRSTITKHIFHQ